MLSGREPAQRLGLASAVNDRSDEGAGEPTVLDLEAVSLCVVDLKLGRERADDLDETS